MLQIIYQKFTKDFIDFCVKTEQLNINKNKNKIKDTMECFKQNLHYAYKIFIVLYVELTGFQFLTQKGLKNSERFL